MTVLLDGTPEAVQAWGMRQARDRVSCREVAAGRSPRKARAFVSVALQVVHRALREVTAAVEPPEAERAYLIKHLHEAVAATVVSPWSAVADDARAAVALELARRCRSIPCLNHRREARDRLVHEMIRRVAADRSTKGWAPASPRLVAFLDGAVLEDLAGDPLHDEYLTKVQRLQTGFGLNTQELAKLLGVSRTSIQKWISGGGVSRDVQARIDEHLANLTRMENHWRPGLLPSIMRRRGRRLQGRTPLQLMLAGKSDQIIEYFDALSDYGATA